MPRVTRKWCVLPARDCSWREKVSKGNKIMYVYTGYVSDKCYEAQIGGRCACKYGYISVWGTCTKAELSSSSQGSQRHCFLLLVAAVTIATNGLLV
ncbi:hypothetical protein BaRGS_00029418 [Batillaria attramentaria]|uniref:Uncharacterized protein n=1 Tax=Batillaria attramentaria TaxID=370345 RepID=A0ABD0JXF0_9CAEN